MGQILSPLELSDTLPGGIFILRGCSPRAWGFAINLSPAKRGAVLHPGEDNPPSSKNLFGFYFHNKSFSCSPLILSRRSAASSKSRRLAEAFISFCNFLIKAGILAGSS